VTTVDEILGRYRKLVVDAMRAALDRPGVEHIALMRYHLGWEDASGDAIDAVGGKMLRPAFCLLACEAAGGDLARALPAAAAIELLHNFTLIHDDIEDASDTRHGRETLWRRAGIPLAINAGDGMFVLAQRTLLDMADIGVSAERVLEASRVLNEACVVLCEGQHADISFEARHRVSLAEYEAMIAGKTAALLGASAQIGAIAGGADDATAAALGACARMLGMGFQVQDDVLGIWGDEVLTGKPVADDIRAKKRSFPVVWAFEHASAAARERLDALYSGEMTDPAVDETVALLDDCGARDASTDAANRWVSEGLRWLIGLELELARREEIEALAAFFVTRDV
jgi:geranylgeranyl diphosphate synthase type I